jgi:hypothetical protein
MLYLVAGIHGLWMLASPIIADHGWSSSQVEPLDRWWEAGEVLHYRGLIGSGWLIDNLLF